uniref:Uncharacterized protein n=1 Tax=Lynx canadensis TaxID=61383 RepID=A0A667GW28_LYNCA
MKKPTESPLHRVKEKFWFQKLNAENSSGGKPSVGGGAHRPVPCGAGGVWVGFWIRPPGVRTEHS